MTLVIDLVPLDEGDLVHQPPDTSTTIHRLSVFLARDVRNAAVLRTRILSPSPSLPDACFIDATLVPSLAVLQNAAAMATQSLPSLRTKSLHAELLWSLGGTKHIGRALSLFGIKDDSTDVLVAKFVGDDDSDESSADSMAGLREAVEVSGTLVEGWEAIEEGLREACDVEKVKKVYKIGAQEIELGSRREGYDERMREGLVHAVVGRIAARDCA